MSVEDQLYRSLIQHGVPVFFAWLVSNEISYSMTQAGFAAQEVVQYQWIGFFACLLIFYGALKMYLYLRGSVQLHP